jgi:predicted AlkP superfamily phosphohydrolase/phosphomutase
MIPTFGARWRQTLPKTLVFVALPLLAELLVYLTRSETYPATLPAFHRIVDLGLVLIYFGILYAAGAIVAAALIALVKQRPETVLPCALFAGFLILTLFRLMPQDSGLSTARILALMAGLAVTALAFILLKKKEQTSGRLLVATIAYAALSAVFLPFLFDLPYAGPVTGGILQVLLFGILFFAPIPVQAILAAVVLFFLLPSRSNLPKFAAPQRLEPYRRVILVGIDGMSPEVVATMTESGKLPILNQLVKYGSGGRLHTFAIPFSPLIWNTIYTGTAPGSHGIAAFTFTKVAGGWPFLTLGIDNWTNSDWVHIARKILDRGRIIRTAGPARSRDRLEPTIWDMADQSGLTSLVVGGWTTYPPQILRGTFISDAALSIGKPFHGTYYPETQDLANLLSLQPDVQTWPADVRRYVARDQRTHAIAVHLIEQNPSAQLVSVYYSAVDAYDHHYGRLIDMKSTAASEKARYESMLEALYKQVDTELGDYLRVMDDRTLLIVCSDHGFHFDKRQHNYRVSGVLLVFGKNVRQGLNVEASVYDIAPTIAYAMDLSPSQDFRELPLRQVFDGIIGEKHAKRYARPTQFYEVADQEGLEEQKLEELRDLQYINR